MHWNEGMKMLKDAGETVDEFADLSGAQVMCMLMCHVCVFVCAWEFMCVCLCVHWNALNL